MNRLRWLGHALLWMGFLAGAYLTVQQVEIPDDKWQTISWRWYGLALGVGIVGVATLRVTARQLATHAARLAADIHTLEGSVRELLRHMAQLRERRHACSVFDVHAWIDEHLMDAISQFVESRQAIAHTYGLQAYAQIMTDFSLAERNINRAWSASADGYVDEVWTSLGRAEGKFQAVAHALTAWRSRGSQGAVSRTPRVTDTEPRP